MKSLIIIGSTQVESHTNTLSRYLRGQLGEYDVEVEIFDLAEKPIHQLDFTGTTQAVNEVKNNAKSLQSKAMGADFLILGMPNYHGSFPGILKDTLDRLSMDHFEMKPVGLIRNNGGIVNSEPLSHLKIVVRNLLGIAIPTQIATHDSNYAKLEDGILYLKGNEFQLHAKLLVDQIISFTTSSPYEHLK